MESRVACFEACSLIPGDPDWSDKCTEYHQKSGLVVNKTKSYTWLTHGQVTIRLENLTVEGINRNDERLSNEL